MIETRFHIFRYQIIPIAQYQISIFDEPMTVEELKTRKNEFFLKALLGINEFTHNRAELVYQIERLSNNLILLRLGANRGLRRETREFEKELIDNWPSACIILNNDCMSQKIAIEIEYKAFRNTTTIAEILEKNINSALKNYYLHISILPIFDKRHFWEIVEKHPTSITETEFRMISPNMSNITENLKLDLHGWNKITNTQETKVVLKSDNKSYLTFSEGDEPVTSMVDYSSQGGGNIKLRVKGYNRKISTSDEVNEISVNDFELDLHDENMQTLKNIFEDLLK